MFAILKITAPEVYRALFLIRRIYMKNKLNIKTIATLGMLSAMAYLLMFITRGLPPIVQWLKYDPKDIIITISGFIFGPIPALLVTTVVSTIEMITVSDTGWIGLIMNILASGVFACTASVVYKKKHTLKGAVLGLILSCILTTGVMILWNYLITPIYMGVPRAVVASMLIPTFLPFNLLKTIANASFTMIIYKPIVKALRAAKLVSFSSSETVQKKSKFIVYVIAMLAIVTCTLIVLVINGVI